MVKWLIRAIKRLFMREKKNESTVLLPIYKPELYDSLYNKTGACKKHEWFFYYNEIDLANTPFAALGNIKSSNRICQKCFLWESKILDEHERDWDFMDFGYDAFNKLTEKKIEAVIV